MDRASALRRLPTAYSNALVWRDAGVADVDIARRLEIPVEAVPSLLRIAEHKLIQLLRHPRPQNDEAESSRSLEIQTQPTGAGDEMNTTVDECAPADHEAMIDVAVRRVISQGTGRALRADGLRQLAVLLGPSGRTERADTMLWGAPRAQEGRSAPSAA